MQSVDSCSLLAPEMNTKINSKDLDQLMHKLDQDNKILAELDKKLKRVVASGGGTGADISHLSSSLPSLNAPGSLAKSMFGTNTPSILYQSKSNLMSGYTAAPSIHNYRAPGEQTLAQTMFNSQLDELKQAEDVVDSIEIPNRGRCKVFIARFNYDPYKQSPNENPEAEVQLMAGDFILVFGNMDEDGFYYGELLDSRRGLVPSNFIEKLTGEDLFEFQASVLYGHNRDSESDTASFPPEFYDALLTETIGHTNFQHLLAPGKPSLKMVDMISILHLVSANR